MWLKALRSLRSLHSDIASQRKAANGFVILSQLHVISLRRLTRCYVALTTILGLIFVPGSALAEDVLRIDRERVFQIGDEAVYLDNPEYKLGDLLRDYEGLTIICFPPNSTEPLCFASLSYKIVPTVQKRKEEREDGTCWDIEKYDSVRVRVYEDGTYKTEQNGGGGSEDSISCENIPPAT